MAGRRILDAALFFNATRSVARQHFRIRSEQLNLWSKTSSLAKAIKYQTDRITVTAQAASALSRRFRDSAPTTQNTVFTQQAKDEPVPNQQRLEPTVEEVRPKDGIKQDHHYERSEGNTATEPSIQGELGVRQEKPERYPTPDGSIPPRGAPVRTVDPKPLNTDTTSKRSESGAQAGLLSQEDHNSAAKVMPEAAGTSTIPEPIQASIDSPQERVSEQDAIPEGINTDVFHTPRVKKSLGEVARRGSQGSMELRGSTSIPVAGAKTSADAGKDTFNVRTTSTESIAGTRQTQQTAATANVLEHSSKAPGAIEDLAADIANDMQSASQRPSGSPTLDTPTPVYEMRESRVPASRFGRIWEYSGLATSMAFGAVGETFRRATGGGTTGSLMLSQKNMERLVAKLSKMRGAALKLGQMMSFQDSKMLPAPIAEVLQRVQNNADYMPTWQRDRVLATNLGADWRLLFSSFDEKPMAAASIGQVHHAVLASTGAEVAVKIQYPGVADSISSDLNNLSLLLTASRLLPKGLYLDKTIANARTELAWECDYEREAQCQERFRSLLVSASSIFTVPAIIPEACGKHVLTAEFMHGMGVTKVAPQLSQQQRDWIGTQILRLSLRELTEFRFMQTDPNWTNFLYNKESGKLELLDFGAAREFPAKFVDPYVGILIAASKGDRETVRELSVQLGYLTGHESSTMINAHLNSVMVLAEPFSEEIAARSGGDAAVYDFREQTITDRVRAQIPIMLRERLAPPPEETYSLHRKLSGAFLMLAKLGSRVNCRRMFVNAIETWEKEQKAERLAGVVLNG